MQRTGDFQSIFNTASVKYTGPLSIVHYDGPRNKDNQMHGDGAILFANGSTYNGSLGNNNVTVKLFNALMGMYA